MLGYGTGRSQFSNQSRTTVINSPIAPASGVHLPFPNISGSLCGLPRNINEMRPSD
jgi:hypothetical protein